MITIYKDNEANAIFIEDANGVQFINSLQATLETGSTQIQITDLARNIAIVSNSEYDDFIDENGNGYGIDPTAVCNALNTMFQSHGDSQGNDPVITSNLAINLTQGETINYELTADYGVGYEWDFSNVPGVVTVEGNPRKIIGGSSLAVGEYAIPVKAINYYGEDSQIIELSVGTPPFANTKSVRFNQNDWLGANAGILDGVLGRNGNGSGSGDAWAISFYFTAGGSSNQEQTIFYFGSNDVANGNHIRVKWNGANNAREQLIFRYGTNNNNLEFKTPVGSVTNDGWHHYVITYNGGTTGSSSGSINDYYSRFKIFIDGVEQTTINSNSNYGITTALVGQNLRVGRYNASGYMRGCKVDELAVWDSDQSSNVPSIYNSGNPFDLSTLGTQPKHWWRMGDGDSYPYLFDVGTEANCIFIMNNMTVADIVNDVP